MVVNKMKTTKKHFSCSKQKSPEQEIKKKYEKIISHKINYFTALTAILSITGANILLNFWVMFKIG